MPPQFSARAVAASQPEAEPPGPPEESFDAFLSRNARRAPLAIGVVIAFFLIRSLGVKPGPVLIFAASAVVLPLSLIRPELGLFALVLNFTNEFDSYYRLQRYVPISLPILFDLAVATGIFLRYAGRRMPSLGSTQSLLLLGYFLLVCFSLLVSPVDVPIPWGRFRSGFLIRPILYLFLITLIRDRRDLYRLLFVLLLGHTLLMISSSSEYLQKGLRLYRVRGTIEAVNYLSYLCIVMIPILLCLFAYLRSRMPRLFVGGLTLVTVFISMQTLSRSGYYALLVTLAFLGTRFVRNPRLLLVGAGFAVLFYELIPAQLIERLAQVQDIQSTSRYLLSRIGLRMALDNPLFGVGWHAYEHEFLRYDDEHIFAGPKAPHSLYFAIAATQGIPALGLYLGMFAVSFLQLRSIERQYLRAGQVRALGYLLSLGLQAALIGHFVFGVAGSYGNSYYAYLLLGMTVVLIQLHRQSPRSLPLQV